tara:strand:+ start:106 stop:549 length:444 start_codon:yes stop_codon:yes gene_type:complete
MAHTIIWCTAGTVDKKNRPRSRILHPFWDWDGKELVGWVGTGATKTKRNHLEQNPSVSINYWVPNQNTCTAESKASWCFDLESRQYVRDRYLSLPEPLGYNPAIIPGWENYQSEDFAVLRFDPWKLRVFPGSALMGSSEGLFSWTKE